MSIRELVRVARAALSAGLVCAPMLLQSRPQTPLRVLCIAAFEYLARLRGGALAKRQRLAIAHACDFGSLCDEYYDEQKLDRSEYRSLRKALRSLSPKAATQRYIQQLRKAERSRPSVRRPTKGATGIIDYRRSVIDLSLQWMQAISGLALEKVRFQSIVSLVCLMQLADDVLDWKEDTAARCPSYVTVLLDRPATGIAGPLRAEADELLLGAVGSAREDAGALPFALAGVATWAFVMALIKVRFPK